jgi:hypothetical protein
MAFTKTQLEALKNALLASNQPITAPIHREFAQKIIDELYDAQSRANLLSAIQNDSSLLTTDSVFVIRNGQGFLIPSSQVGGTGSLANLTDTVIIDPQDGEVIIYNSVTEKWENRVAGVVFNDFYVRHDIDNQGLNATQKSNATTNIGAQSISEKGQADGYASLDGTGRVPSSQLPSFVDDVLEFPTLGDFPVTGETGKIYIALDTNKTYRWGGTTYVEISAGVVLGETESTAYRGDRGKIAYDYSQIGHLPLTGGTLASSGSTNTLNIDHASGSGLALNITKAGNDEGLKVVKTSGSGLAASITGGVTLLDELNLTTKLADAHISSADTWNNKIGGTIATGQVAFGTAAGVIGGDSGLVWNNVNKRLGVGTNAPAVKFHISDGNPFGTSFDASADLLLTKNATSVLSISVASNTATSRGVFNSTRYRGTLASPLAVKSADNITTFLSGAYDGSNIQNSAGLFFDAESDASPGNAPQQINLVTGVSGATRTTKLQVRSNGNVLIQNGGTFTDAGFRLDVNGTARIVGATRIDSLAGTGTRMVVADANGVMSTQALGIAGSGTLNRLAKFTAGGTVGDSQVFDNGTNVGIGTDSPSAKLDVNETSSGAITNCITLTNASNTINTEAGLFFAPTTATGNIRGARITGLQEDGNNAIGLKFYTGVGETISEKMRITSGGNVGIGTDSPSLLFSVLNKVGVDNDGRLFWGSDFSGNNRGLLTWDANSARIQSGSTSTSLDFAIGTGDIRMRLSTNNNLLINTTADAGFKLDVNGTGRFTGDLKADTRIGVGVSPLHDIHISKAGQDTAIVTEVTSTNRAATNNSLSNVAGVSIAAFGSTYPESGGSRWAGRAGVYINTGKPNQTFNVWIGNKTIMNSLNTGWTAIGQNDPIAFFHVQGSAVVDGSMSANSYITTSDKRKKDIISQDGELATYQFKGDDQIHYGYIAQDMQDLYPNQVSTDNDGMMSLNYIEILVKKVHDLEKEIQLLKNK